MWQVEFGMTRVDDTEDGERRRQEFLRKMELIGEELYDIPATPEERKRRLDQIVVRVPDLRRYVAGSLEEYKSLSDEEITRQLRRWAPLGDLLDFNREIVEWSDGSTTGGSDEEGPPLRAGVLRESAAEGDEGGRRMKTQKLPETDSIDELARFWDTHDLTDFEDQLEEVPRRVFRRRSKPGVNIRLAPDEMEAAERSARDGGRDLGALLHDWVIEKLNEVLRTRQPSEAK